MKLFFAITAVFFITVSLFSENYSDFKSALQAASDNSVKTITAAMAPAMQFYTGSGDISGCVVQPFPSWAIGIGAGVTFTPNLFNNYAQFNNLGDLKFDTSENISNSISKIASLASIVPLPYDMIVGKVGLPIIPNDVGIRVGFIPSLNYSMKGFDVGVSGFHIGGDIRQSLVDAGIFKIDAGLSLDFDSGKVFANGGTNQEQVINGVDVATKQVHMQFTYDWSGLSLGAKIQLGIYDKSAGGLFVGIGGNCNMGGVNTALLSDIAFIPTIIGVSEQQDSLSSKSTKSYDLFDLRAYAGFRLYFIQFTAEYGFPSGYISATFYPVILAF